MQNQQHQSAPHFGHNAPSLSEAYPSTAPPANKVTSNSPSIYPSQSSSGAYAATTTGGQYSSYQQTSTSQQHQSYPTSVFPGQTSTHLGTSAMPGAYSEAGTSYQQQAYQGGPVTTTTTTSTREVQQYGSPANYVDATAASSHYMSSQNLGGSASASRYVSGTAGYSAASGAGYSTSQYNRMASGATETTRVIGHEYGPERVISVSQRVDDSRSHIVSERWVEHEVKIPKKIIREEVIEKTIIVPETVVREEVQEVTQKVRQKVVEVAKERIEERIVEVPEYEIVEKIIEVPQVVRQEKVREELQVQYQERIVEVPKIVYEERLVEIPDVKYVDVPVERVVEIPEFREEVIVKQVPVPQHVEKPFPQYVDVTQYVDVDRNIPVPVEAIVAYEFKIPKLRGNYTKVTYPVYLPRFVETPIAAELYNATITTKAENYLQQISSLTRTAASLCEIENLAASIMQTDLITQCQQVDVQTALLQAWQSGAIPLGGMTSTHNNYQSPPHAIPSAPVVTAGSSGSTYKQTTTSFQ